jgi:diguanylate cyclase (GGDEF)-like protein
MRPVPSHRGDLTDPLHSAQATGATGLDGILGTVVEAVGAATSARWVELWTFETDRDAILCRAAWSDGRADQDRCDGVGMAIGLGQSHDMRRLILTGAPLVRSLGDPSLGSAERAALEAEGYESRVDYPLLAGDRVLGILSFARPRGVGGDAGERELGRLAPLAAAALDATLKAEQQHHHLRRLWGLLDPSRSIAASLRVRDAVQRARADIAESLPGVALEVEVCARREDGSFAPAAGDGTAAGGRERSADALARQAVAQRRSEQARAKDGRARLLVPLVVGERALGYVELFARLARRFRPEEVELVTLIAGQVAVALLNARAFQALESRAAVDGATGLYTRWYFYERLYGEVARGRRYQQPLSVVMGEVDGAERLYAERGRKTGDLAVHECARLVRFSLRDKVDVACRVGRARFALLLPNTSPNLAGAGVAAERVRRTVEATTFQSLQSSGAGRLTATLAVAGFPADAEEPDDLAAAAEQVLDTAVAAGGNRVAFAGR